MAFVSKFTGPEIDRRLAQGTYDDAVAAGFTGTKEQFDAWIAAYTPEEMGKLNNKQDKEDPMLETENKTVVGAINLLNSEKQDKEDERLATESKIVVDAINELNTRTTDLYYDKQDKEDSGLATEQKTIVGAINELKLELQDQDSQKQDKVDDGFATNDKSVVGAVNEIHNELDTHVADYNKHVDEYEAFKADTENTLNSHSTQIGQLTQEKQDKTDFNLATESKTIVSAINENYAAINAEITRAIAEDARLEEVKVPYTDISDSSNPDRKTIMLKNHDSISGYGTDGTAAYNLAMVSKWDKADFGSTGISINLNGSEAHPTYNDKEELAFVSELTGEASRLDEDIKNLNETIATVNQNLSANIATLNQNVTDGFNTINGGINNEIRPAIEKNAKDIGVVNDTLTQKIEETEEKLQEDINYLKPRVATLETLQIKSVNPDSENYAASYELQDSTGKAYGVKINVAKDQFLKSVGYADNILTLTFILADGTEYPQQVDLTGLVDEYIAGAGISVTTTDDGKKVINIADDALQKIQYADSEVRRLEQDKIPYAYDEKTQSNINVILPEGGSYLGNYGDENATIAKAAVYDGIKQLELGSSKVHTNINTDSDVTIETSDGKKVIATTDQIPDVFETKGLTELETGESSAKIEAALGIDFVSLIEIIRENKTIIVDRNSAGDYKACIHASGNISGGNGGANLMFFIGTTPTIYQVQYVGGTFALAVDEYAFAEKSDIPDISNLATKEEITSKVDWVDYNNTKNIVLPSNGQVFGDFGGEESNSSLLGARIYNAGLENEAKQVEVGTSKVHLNLNSSDKPTIETSDGKENLVVESDIELMPKEIRIPIRSIKDKIYTQEEILGWFGVEDIVSLKKIIAYGGIQYVKYGLSLSTNPHYYKMPVEYVAFESANQIKLVFVGLNTRDDVTSKYEMIMNLDGTIIEGNSNVKMTVTSIEPGDIDLSKYATKEELNDYTLKSELPDVSNLATKDEIPSLDGYATTVELENKVDKIEGKQLSTEDYTTEEKEKLASLENYDDTSLRSELQQTETGVATANTEIEKLKSGKQDTLVSGENIKTINGESLLGSGDIEITGGSSEVTWDNVTGKPSFATVATSGSYSDLTGTPDLSSYQSKSDDTLNTTDKTVVGAINEVKSAVDAAPSIYELNGLITMITGSPTSEQISTAIGGWDNLVAAIHSKKLIVDRDGSHSITVVYTNYGMEDDNTIRLYSFITDALVSLIITNTDGTLSIGFHNISSTLSEQVADIENKLDNTLPVYTTVPELTASYTIPANTSTREYIYEIPVGATVYNINGASGIKWKDGIAPVVVANKTYVISVIHNLAVWGEF